MSRTFASLLLALQCFYSGSSRAAMDTAGSCARSACACIRDHISGYWYLHDICTSTGAAMPQQGAGLQWTQPAAASVPPVPVTHDISKVLT